jgi:hypothetical protein
MMKITQEEKNVTTHPDIAEITLQEVITHQRVSMTTNQK